MTLIELLKSLRDNNTVHPAFGICNHVIGISDECPISDVELAVWRRHRTASFAAWEKFSGNNSYPIPSPYSHMSDIDVFYDIENLWDKRSKYGKLRWQLLDHLIEYFEAPPENPLTLRHAVTETNK